MKNDFKKLVRLLTLKNKTISAMESCTGGSLVNEITNIEGASVVIKFSAVTYSNGFKIKMGVNKSIIDTYTVYSIETANEMSKAIVNFTNSNYGVGITGKLSKEKENIVYISIYDRDNNKFYNEILKLDKIIRYKNKTIIVNKVCKMLINIIN